MNFKYTLISINTFCALIFSNLSLSDEIITIKETNDFVIREVTLDFKLESPSVAKWRAFDFASATANEEEDHSNKPWNLRLKQAYLGTHNAIVGRVEAGMGKTELKFDDVKLVPNTLDFAADEKQDPDTFMGPAPVDMYNAKLMTWKDYYASEDHLSYALPQFIFIVRTADDHFVKIKFLDYIKNGKAIRLKKRVDFFGRIIEEGKATLVSKEDGLIHLKFIYMYNKKPKDTNLSEVR